MDTIDLAMDETEKLQSENQDAESGNQQSIRLHGKMQRSK